MDDMGLHRNNLAIKMEVVGVISICSTYYACMLLYSGVVFKLVFCSLKIVS